MVRGLWVGDPATGAAAMQPLQQIEGCITQWTGTGRYSDVLYKLLNFPQDQPVLAYKKVFEDKGARFVARDLTADEWTSILNYYLTTPNNLSYMYLEFYGGQINAYPRDQSAFIHRDTVFNAVMDVFWYVADDRLAAEKFLNGWIKLMETMWNGEMYQNYVSLNVNDYASCYWADALFGLYAVKQKYDPEHAFSFAQEVRQPMKLAPGDPAAPARRYRCRRSSRRRSLSLSSTSPRRRRARPRTMPPLPRFDVGEWLAQLGLAGYAQAFRDNDIDAAVLRTLTQDDLREIGVASVGHRRRILDAAARLGESPDSAPAAEPAAAPQPAGDRRAAERRMLTIMFCDLVDSTACRSKRIRKIIASSSHRSASSSKRRSARSTAISRSIPATA